MSALPVLPEQITTRLAWVLIHFLWQGAAIAILLALSVRLGRIHRPSHRYSLGLIAMGAMVICPAVTFCLVRPEIASHGSACGSWGMRGDDNPNDQTTNLLNVPGSISKIDVGNRPLIRDSLPGASLTNDFPSTMGSEPDANISQAAFGASPNAFEWNGTLMPWNWKRLQTWIVTVWLLGVAILSARLMLGWIGIWRLRRTVEPVPAWIGERLQSICVSMRVAQPLIHLSHQISEAFALGFAKPMILIPVAWITELSPQMIEAVIAHELAHIRRGDLWVNLLQRLVETLLFYHPAVWWLSRQLRIDRELCCDELAVLTTQDRVRYAETLEHVGRLSIIRSRTSLAMSMGGNRQVLLNRIRHVLSIQSTERTSSIWVAGLLSLAVPLGVWLSTTSLPDAKSHVRDLEQSLEPKHKASEQVASAIEASNVVNVSVEEQSLAKQSSGANLGDSSKETISSENRSQTLAKADRPEPNAAEQSPYQELDQKIDDALNLNSRRYLIADAHSPWQIGNWVMAFGAEAELRKREPIRAIDWIASGPAFDNQPLWLASEWGGRAHPFTRPYAFEGHPTQFLAWLSTTGLSRDFKFKLDAGSDQTITVQDVINDAKHRVGLKNEEVAWTLWALSNYEPLDAEWLNSKGDTWSITRLVEVQVDQPLDSLPPNGGLMGLYALANARRRYREQPDRRGKSLPAVWKIVDHKLKNSIDTTRRLQNMDGTFSSRYFVSEGHTTDANKRLSTTGGALMWLIAALPDDRLREPWLMRAVDAVCSELITNKKRELDIGPLAESIFAIRSYRDRTRGSDRIHPQEVGEATSEISKGKPETVVMIDGPVNLLLDAGNSQAGQPTKSQLNPESSAERPKAKVPLGVDERELRINPRDGKGSALTLTSVQTSDIPPFQRTEITGGVGIEIIQGNGLEMSMTADKAVIVVEANEQSALPQARTPISSTLQIELKENVVLGFVRRAGEPRTKIQAAELKTDLVLQTLTAMKVKFQHNGTTADIEADSIVFSTRDMLKSSSKRDEDAFRDKRVAIEKGIQSTQSINKSATD